MTERRRATDSLDERLTKVELGLADLKLHVMKIETHVESIAGDTQDIRDIWKEARSAFHFFTRVMGVVRWILRVVLWVVMPVGALYAMFTGAVPTWLHVLAAWLEKSQ